MKGITAGLLLSCFSVQAVEVTLEQWQQLESQAVKIVQWHLANVGIAKRDELDAKQILDISRNIDWLYQQKTLTTEQTQWLEQASKVGGTVTTRSSDHPEKPIHLINLTQQANATLRWHESKQKVANILAAQTPITLELLEKQAYLVQQLLIKWASLEQVRTLQQALLATYFYDLDVTNKTLYRLGYQLLLRLPDIELAGAILSHADNEFSVQYVRQVPENYDEDDAMQLLGLAAESDYLRSLAYQLMASHYNSAVVTQERVLKGMQKPTHFWQAIMVAEQFDWGDKQPVLKQLQRTLPPRQADMIANLMKQEQL
ncbi:MAG: hypothetical protein ACFHVJ_00120 [Aestuariibacter sp.]